MGHTSQLVRARQLHGLPECSSGCELRGCRARNSGDRYGHSTTPAVIRRRVSKAR